MLVRRILYTDDYLVTHMFHWQDEAHYRVYILSANRHCFAASPSVLEYALQRMCFQIERRVYTCIFISMVYIAVSH